MQSKFTQLKFGNICTKIIALALIFSASTQFSFAQQKPSKLKQPSMVEKVQQRLKSIELSKNPGSGSVPSVGLAPVQMGAKINNIDNPAAGNPNSRAFCYNGPAGAFQLNKQSVLNTTLTPIGAPIAAVFPGATAWVTTTNQLYEIDQATPFGLYRVDTVTGVRTFIVNCTGVPQANLTGMTWDASTNTMYGVSSSIAVSQIFTMNIVTGVCTPIGAATAVVAGAIMLNAAPGGSLFSVDIVADNLYRWNKTTGVPALIGALGVNANFGQDGHFDPSDGQYYWAAAHVAAVNTFQLRIIDTLTGASTIVGAYGGQVETFGIFSAPLTVCSGAPNPGNTVSSANPVCPTVPFSLSLQNNPAVSGLTYQWQSAPAVGGPWLNISGATGASYGTSITVATAYRCNVTCGTTTTTSNPLLVTITPPSGCYCSGGATDVIDEKISRVRYNTIDNPSSSTAGYENFTAISTTVIQGSTQSITVDISNFFTGDLVKVWIDYNQNGSWTDPGEEVVSTTNTAANPATGNITIPLTSSIGPTRMRVRLYWQPADANPGPCGNTAYGQVEDYTVDIQPCIQGVFNTQPANQTIQCGGTASFSVTTTGSLLTYGWEYKTSAASTVWLNVPNAAPYSGVNTNTLTITNAPQTLNGYVYRAVIQGPCTAVDFSNSATLTVGPYVVTFNPPPTNPVTICTGTLQQISISNLVSGTSSQNFTSGAISIPIPDGNNSGSGPGINHIIPVSLPGGSQITSLTCTVNINNHTWVGDLCFVLKAPNNNILNLDYFLSGTGAGPSSPTGMVNTRFSPPPVSATLGGGVSPYTGTFKPDAALTGALGNAGPNGFIPNVTTLPALYSIPNGNWTLAVYDGFGGDIGNLINWQLDITYTIPVFATGTWTGPAGTMWATAAGSGGAAYVTGTQATSIWVNPTASSNNYTATVSTATPCISSGTVTVNVTNPATIALAGQPVNRSACVGSNTSFSVVAGGGPLTYQWQQSIDGGLNWTNISGATGSTLNLTAVIQLMNNYLYRVNVTASPCGTVTSAVAKLTTFELPTVTISSTTLQLVPGVSALITGTSVPGPLTANSWSWTLNGNPILGAVTNSVSANIDQQGSYRATVTDINGCVGSSNIITIGSQVSDYLWIYPNPNRGQFQVRLYHNGAQAERRKVRIYNMGGQLMAQKEFDLVTGTHPYLSMTFDLPLLSAGTYVVKVVDRHERKITSGLMVIQ
jgi:subtilisin-like proprotein convertase family protein